MSPALHDGGGVYEAHPVLLLAAMALTLAVARGVALAVNEIGTNGPDTLRGPTGTTSRAVALTTYCGVAVAATTSLAGPAATISFSAATNRFFSRGDKNLVGGSGNYTVIGGRHKGGPSMSS
jgi:hypothetical protein